MSWAADASDDDDDDDDDDADADADADAGDDCRLHLMRMRDVTFINLDGADGTSLLMLSVSS